MKIEEAYLIKEPKQRPEKKKISTCQYQKEYYKKNKTEINKKLCLLKKQQYEKEAPKILLDKLNNNYEFKRFPKNKLIKYNIVFNDETKQYYIQSNK